MIKHSEYLNKKKDSVIANGSITPDLYDFYMKVFVAQEEFTSEIGDLSEYSNFFKKEIFPTLAADSITLNDNHKTLLYNLMIKLTGIISTVNAGMDFLLFTENFKKDADLLPEGEIFQCVIGTFLP